MAIFTEDSKLGCSCGGIAHFELGDYFVSMSDTDEMDFELVTGVPQYICDGCGNQFTENTVVGQCKRIVERNRNK